MSRAAGKPARPVLRGRGCSNAPPLPDEIETAYLELKSTVLGGRVLRARTPDGVEQEVYALPEAQYLTDERAGGPRPPPWPSPHPPFPGRPAPGNHPGSGRTQGNARSTLRRMSSRNMPTARPVRPSVEADGYTDRASGTKPVRYASVDTAI